MLLLHQPLARLRLPLLRKWTWLDSLTVPGYDVLNYETPEIPDLMCFLVWDPVYSSCCFLGGFKKKSCMFNIWILLKLAPIEDSFLFPLLVQLRTTEW